MELECNGIPWCYFNVQQILPYQQSFVCDTNNLFKLFRISSPYLWPRFFVFVRARRKHHYSSTIAYRLATCELCVHLRFRIYIQGSPSGGGHGPPGGDASRMTTTN